MPGLHRRRPEFTLIRERGARPSQGRISSFKMFANRVSRHRTSTKRAPVADAQKIHVESVNHPGRVRSVDAEMYQAMKAAFL